MNADHVIAHDGTGKLGSAMECLHCGDVQPVAVPIQPDIWLVMGRKYAELHANCQPRKDGKES